MDIEKLYDIVTKPPNMDIFFNSFIEEFEKTIFGGGRDAIVTFFEDGPRDGYSTFFKGLTMGFWNYHLLIKFNITESSIKVFMGREKGNDATFENLGPYIEAAIKKALRNAFEMRNPTVNAIKREK